jgi:cytosine/adenosine deaminase-related metal-dependent hydrolase
LASLATILRSVMRADDPQKTYFPVTFALGVHYTPEDSYRAVRLGLAEAIAAGVTTTHMWNGPLGKCFFSDGSSRRNGAVICPAFQRGLHRWPR